VERFIFSTHICQTLFSITTKSHVLSFRHGYTCIYFDTLTAGSVLTDNSLIKPTIQKWLHYQIRNLNIHQVTHTALHSAVSLNHTVSVYHHSKSQVNASPHPSPSLILTFTPAPFNASPVDQSGHRCVKLCNYARSCTKLLQSERNFDRHRNFIRHMNVTDTGMSAAFFNI